MRCLLMSDTHGIDQIADLIKSAATLARKLPEPEFNRVMGEVRRFLESLTPEQAADLATGNLELVLTDTGEWSN